MSNVALIGSFVCGGHREPAASHPFKLHSQYDVRGNGNELTGIGTMHPCPRVTSSQRMN